MDQVSSRLQRPITHSTRQRNKLKETAETNGNLTKELTRNTKNQLEGELLSGRAATFDVPVMIHNNTAHITVWGESRSVLQGFCPKMFSQSCNFPGTSNQAVHPLHDWRHHIETKGHQEAL